MQTWLRIWLAGWCFGMAIPAWGAETPQQTEPEEPLLAVQIGTKFARGVTNFCLGWTEIPKQIYLVGQSEGWLAGAIRGPFDGLGMFGSRTIAGMFEVFTFPLPLPLKYQPLVEPAFVWEPEASDPAATNQTTTASMAP